MEYKRWSKHNENADFDVQMQHIKLQKDRNTGLKWTVQLDCINCIQTLKEKRWKLKILSVWRQLTIKMSQKQVICLILLQQFLVVLI